MDRRHFLQTGVSAGVVLTGVDTFAYDKWGSPVYPTGWGGRFEEVTAFRVGNYSGGFEGMFPHNKIAASSNVMGMTENVINDFSYRWGFSKKTIDDYLNSWPTTGILISRDSNIFIEKYRHDRTSQMRLTSWSMAKSVSSLLLGICLDKKLIDSYDDLVQKYLPELEGTLHGGVTLRNLSNMSSGADISHERDNKKIYPNIFFSSTGSIAKSVQAWNQKSEEQGRRYNYNELCPLTLGMVIRKVSNKSISAFAESVLWQPMGAESNATWSTDSERNEFNCVGFAATLRDWARLGILVANKGLSNGNQVVSERWINECTTWSELDKQVKFGVPSNRFGYKAHMWHSKPDGSRLYFNGHHGQRVIIDMPTKTVLVHTAVQHEGNWQAELFELFDSATKI